MPAMQIADPKADANDRYAGVSSVKSNGTVALRHEAGVLVAQAYGDTPTFVVSFAVAATVALDILALQPPTAKVLRLRRIVLVNPGVATAAAVVDAVLGVATGIGSGGTALTVGVMDVFNRSAGVTGGPDTSAGAVARAGDTTQATGFTAYYSPLVSISVPAAAAGFTPLTIYDASDPRCKPLTVCNGNVVVLRTPAVGAGAANLRGYAEYTMDDA